MLVDNENSLRVEGLKNYYLRNGRLSIDNALIGIGSLNEQLSGKLNINVVYEPDTFTTLLSLVGENWILKNALLKTVTAIAAVKEVRFYESPNTATSLCTTTSATNPTTITISTASTSTASTSTASTASTTLQIKLEGGLERLSELFSGIDGYAYLTGSNSGDSSDSSDSSSWQDIGNWINQNILTSPGWLARCINDMSEYLSDGDRGIIPALRAFVGKSFGKYDEWSEKIFPTELPDKIQVSKTPLHRLRIQPFKHTLSQLSVYALLYLFVPTVYAV